MVVVDDLDERLHPGSLGNALLTHALCDLQWVALDTGDNSMGERLLLCALVKVLDDHSLLTGVASLKDQYNLCEVIDRATISKMQRIPARALSFHQKHRHSHSACSPFSPDHESIGGPHVYSKHTLQK